MEGFKRGENYRENRRVDLIEREGSLRGIGAVQIVGDIPLRFISLKSVKRDPSQTESEKSEFADGFVSHNLYECHGVY